jgi:hypothetical protein
MIYNLLISSFQDSQSNGMFFGLYKGGKIFWLSRDLGSRVLLVFVKPLGFQVLCSGKGGNSPQSLVDLLPAFAWLNYLARIIKSATLHFWDDSQRRLTCSQSGGEDMRRAGRGVLIRQKCARLHFLTRMCWSMDESELGLHLTATTSAVSGFVHSMVDWENTQAFDLEW